MQQHTVKLLSVNEVTHDVKSFRFEKPEGYHFSPGQATELSLNKPGWENERRPFTFTSLNEDPWLEFTIKRYADHHGVTDQLHQLVPGDEFIIHDVWGAIEYKGPGYFIAGGAGITPFVAILRSLKKKNEAAGNVLFFSNKTENDIIYKKEFEEILGNDAHFIITRDDVAGSTSRRIDREFLENQHLDLKKHFYVCGPDPMVQAISDLLSEIGANTEYVVFEK